MESGGASAEPCAENYGGPYPNSEPEIKALSEFVAGIKSKVNILLAFHSYSQLLLSPYGHSTTERPENYDDLMKVAKAFADAVEALPYGTEYEYGTSAEVLCKSKYIYSLDLILLTYHAFFYRSRHGCNH